MISSEDTVLILGAGQAGGQCAASLRRFGFEGRIILAGSEPHPPYQRPPLSKAYLSGEIEADRLWLQPPETWEEQKVDLRTGLEAISIDRAQKTVRFADGSSENYSCLIIATGSRVRKLPVEGADLESVRYLRNIADVDALKSDFSPGKRIAVIGGGYIGLEAAAVAKKLGAKPVVIEALDRLLARVAQPELSDYYKHAHQSRGVDIRLSAKVESLLGKEGHVCGVRLASGDVIECDSVLVGIGVIPNQELATEAGLKTGNGIVVNEDCQTSDPAIFAIGDCAEGINPVYHRRIRLESVPNALEQAKTAAATICEQPAPEPETPWFWSDQFDLKLQSAGLVTGTEFSVIRGDMDSGNFAIFHFAGDFLLAADAINDPPSFMAAKMMIAKGATPDPREIENTDIPIKDIMKACLAK